MKQVVQPLSGGPVTVLDVPRPSIGATEVLVRTVASVISAGTERAVSELAQSSLLAKARARPDLVRQVIKKAKTDGLAATAGTVRARLASDLPLGYSAAGIAVEVGEAVPGVRPGQLIATGGAGKANHAEWQAVPGMLCAVVPEGVTAEDAAFATVASIAMHGFRQAEVAVGSKVAVIGLGLIGQLAARIAMAAGCDVVGLDPDAAKRERAATSGVTVLDQAGNAAAEQVARLTRGRGVDAVLVCAASKGSELMASVPPLCRDRARVVIVGDVGLDLDRTPFYEREIELLFARSYGPGRYERSYEEWAVDYPPGYVRWSEGRNLEAVLDLLSARRLAVSDLVTHRFAIEEAAQAYELISAGSEPYLAVAVTYPRSNDLAPSDRVQLRPTPPPSGSPGIGWIGSGGFSTSVLLPAFRAAGYDRFVAVASASGLSAVRMAERAEFARAVSGADEVIDDPDVDLVVIATGHSSHADLAVRALRAGKDVWVEKPAALSIEELDDVENAIAASGRRLAIGYNRRYSPAVIKLRELRPDSALTVVYRVAAGPVPDEHWYGDRREGGRLLGEVCHFVDMIHAIVDSPIESVRAVMASGWTEPALSPSAAIALSFADGSTGVIAYSGAATSGLAKERIEVIADSFHGVIDDFTKLTVNGRTAWSGRQDKGHGAAVATFKAGVASSDTSSTRVTVSALADALTARQPSPN